MTSDESSCWNWRTAVRGVCSHQFHLSNQRSEYAVISRPAAYLSQPTALACDLLLRDTTHTHTRSLSILNSHQLYNISKPLPLFPPRNFFLPPFHFHFYFRFSNTPSTILSSTIISSLPQSNVLQKPTRDKFLTGTSSPPTSQSSLLILSKSLPVNPLRQPTRLATPNSAWSISFFQTLFLVLCTLQGIYFRYWW